MTRISTILGAFACAIATDAWAQSASVAAPPTDHLKDPVELCQKLAGTERAICEKQAREAPRGATGSVKPEDDKRANTPPGTSRSGDGPAAGAIADPAGVTKR